MAYTLEWPSDEGPRAGRYCTCSFCTKHNNNYLSHPDAVLDLTIADTEKLNRYSFATGTAQFLICLECGVMPVVLGHQNGELQGVVNANTLENFKLPEASTPVTYDGESIDLRLERRKKTWIGRVTVKEGS
jgi:hypothetical protein